MQGSPAEEQRRRKEERGANRERGGKWVECMTDVDRDATYFLPPPRRVKTFDDLILPTQSTNGSTFPSSRPSKGQAGHRCITITHPLGNRHHCSTEGSQPRCQRSHTLKQELQHHINAFVCNVIMFLLLSRIHYKFTDYWESNAIMQYEAVKK